MGSRGTDRAGPAVRLSLLRDRDRPGTWTLLVDGVAQSAVDLDDPTHLLFEYVRRMGHVVDAVAAPTAPLDVVHLGGGALSLARYVAVTRPGSRQRVFEVDAEVIDLVRARLPLPRGTRVRVRRIDARDGLVALREDSADVVVGDVFAGSRTPAHLTTVECVEQIARVLRPGGSYVLNVADGPPLHHARRQVATLRAVLPEVLVVAEPGSLRGRRFANLVLLATRADPPVTALRRAVAADPHPARVLAGADVERFAGGARPATDATAEPSPPPPAELFTRPV